jgi:hypothetical protein
MFKGLETMYPKRKTTKKTRRKQPVRKAKKGPKKYKY